MTMTIDPSQQRFAPFDQMSYSTQPQFSNPWASSTAGSQAGNQGMYVTSHEHGLPSLGLGNGMGKHTQQTSVPRTSAGPNASLASYGAIPVTAASADHLLSLNRLPQQTSAAGYDTTYATASPAHPTYPPSTTASYDLGYVQAPNRSTFALPPGSDAQARRFSHSSMQAGDDRRAFADALEASHGMLEMSQETPRNIYGPAARSRGSADSYGFPSTHSTSSSISSAGYGSYYAGSVDSSVTDYSSAAGSDIESVGGRTLPRPQGLMASQAPPAPQSMMGQFSSKVTSSTQKKHKCKVCDKRFTRPSSLQTHMYSHTGEKPFCCEVEGCGRHFSVVSNLRRHRKVHKGGADAQSETGSEDHHSEYSDDK